MADIKKLLDKFIGTDNAEAVRKTSAEAAKALDEMGIARKQGDGETADANATAETMIEAVDAAGATDAAATTKAVMAALDSAGALKAIQDASIDVTALVAALLKAVAMPEAVEDTSAEGAAGESPMAGEMMKALSDYVASSTKDMGEIARGQATMAEAVKAILDNQKDLSKRIEAVEAKQSGAPRMASKATETVVDPNDKNHKALIEAAEKSVSQPATFLGIPVRQDYIAKRNGKE